MGIRFGGGQWSFYVDPAMREAVGIAACVLGLMIALALYEWIEERSKEKR